MNNEEVDSLLRSFLFEHDSERSTHDTWSYAQYTKLDKRGNLLQAHLHKDANGDVKVNLERHESEEVSVEGSVVHVTTEKVVEGIGELKTLEVMLNSLMK